MKVVLRGSPKSLLIVSTKAILMEVPKGRVIKIKHKTIFSIQLPNTRWSSDSKF